MKKLLFFFLALLFLLSCANSGSPTPATTYVSSREADSLAFSYLELKDEQYVLRLSEQEAEKMDISSFDYKRIVRDVQAANAMLREIRESGGEIELIDPQEELRKRGLK